MATATIPDTRTTPPAIIEYDISALEQRVTDARAAYQEKVEPLGIDFGKACSELREKGEVVQFGTGGRESFLRAVVLGAAFPYEFGRTATAGK